MKPVALLDTKFPQETAELKAGHTSGPRVGDLLSATRAQKGMELQDIANVLRIRLAYLEALENGDHGKLPGHTYALGFVRAYATYLGLDGESVARRFKVEASDFANPSELIFPIPVSESGIPGGAVVFVGLLIAAVVYGGVYFGTSEDGYLRELISPVPEHMAEAVAGKQSADEASMTKVEKETGVSPSSATAAMPHADQNVMPAADAGEISETGVTGSEKPVVATQREEAEPQSALTSGRSQVVSGGEAVP
ncbi:MAG: helix-turn-helix domain-containing protein, partial [Rhodospirillales bacterium]|nr:helix-turn-helix domain-containing protein [Rhodospirillales bacterium]